MGNYPGGQLLGGNYPEGNCPVPIKIKQHQDANFDVLIQKKRRKTKKTSFLKETVENADLYKFHKLHRKSHV